jgi:hydroxymethylpyrimidine/phosphomethylpyrimidine kinase
MRERLLDIVGGGHIEILTAVAAIACNLASGTDMERSVRLANRYVEAGIKFSTDIGRGSGPINHFHSTYRLPFAP